MNYHKHYTALMERSPKKRPKGVYLERHRIIPGCMGGKYVTDNIAFLTPEEHFVAHQLLVKMHPQIDGLVFAVNSMTVDNGRSDRSLNKFYGWLRRKFATAQSKRMMGNDFGRGLRGYKQTEEHKENVAKATGGRATRGMLGKHHSDETKALLRKLRTGKKCPHSEETKNKIRMAKLGVKLGPRKKNDKSV